jgi:hypothetical protein
VKLTERRGALELVFLQLAVIRSKVIEAGKKFKYKNGELFKHAYKELYQISSDKELLEKWMKYWDSHIVPMSELKLSFVILWKRCSKNLK